MSGKFVCLFARYCVCPLLRYSVNEPTTNDQRTTNNGVVLITVVIIMLMIALIGASLVAFFSSVHLSAQRVADEAKALYLAEAGIARAVRLLRTQAGAGGLTDSIGPVTLGEGAYTVRIDFTEGLITSTGSVGGIDKTVQLQYSTL